MIKICEECGKSFETNRSNARWCNSVHTRKCIICGNEFELNGNQLVQDKKCCSRKCSTAYAHSQQINSLNDTVRVCEECGKSFVPTNNNQRYCTDVHYRSCPVCGKPVEVKPHDLSTGIHRTCSKQCEVKMILEKRKESDIDNTKYGTCIVCGAKFVLHPPYNQKTCSRRCGGIYRKQSGISKQVYEKASKTNLERYGKSNPGQVKAFNDKRDERCLELYGSKKVLALPEFQEKARQTSISKFGTPYAVQSDEIKKKLQQSCIERFGVNNYFSTVKNIQSIMSNPDKLSDWLLFKKDCKQYISDNFDEKPNIHQLCEKLGVTDTRIYDIAIEQNARDMIAHFSSVVEQEIFDFLCTIIPDTEIIRNDRASIKPYEIDIYIPEYNLGIECNPSITHNSSLPDQFGGSPKPYNYHKIKSDLAAKQGIRLFHIFGWDWKYKRTIIESMLVSALGKCKKLYARNCYVSVVDYETTRAFLNNNHRQGYASYKWSLGLYNKISNEFVSLMTFGLMRNGQGKKSDDTDSIELVRFCNILNTSVAGGASKLLKHFIRDYGHSFSKIVSFSDVAHTSGNLYHKLGFVKVSQSQPGYTWAKISTEETYSRVQCQKANLRKLFNDPSIDIENKTEKQIMMEHGYVQVFDAGTIRWEYYLNN